MPVTTRLAPADLLPLTCSRSGTCCHGKRIGLNPWELACLAEARGLTPGAFREAYCDFGGIRLRFDGPPGWKRRPACSQYVPGFGCGAHPGRPLACRLYPLGRQKQGGEICYIYQGKEFPCLDGCPEVADLSHLSVADYLVGQAVERFEAAQDEYLELMENLADGAFALLLESGLAESGDRKTLRLWREMGREDPGQLANRIGPEWMDRLMLPEVTDCLDDPAAFSHRHYGLLQAKAQEAFGALDNFASFSEASGIMMGLALHLGCGLGAKPADLAGHWIKTANKHGAQI